jgi:LuxR family glucitol operon transcriptional activator
MDILVLIGILAAIIGIIAGIVQVLDYLEKRRKRADEPKEEARTPSTPPVPQIPHNLPQPEYGTFVGRQKELAKVRELLSPTSRHFLVTIDGVGGVGKSALALEIAHSYLREYDTLPEEERFDAIIWTSAKAAMLTADGIVPRQQVTRALDDIYTTLSVTLEREDIIRAVAEEQEKLVARALARRRTLLIVDNLETVDDERVNAFLRELPAPTKAIVTTRHRIDVAYPVRLTGMPEGEGLALIAQECAKKGVTLTDTEAKKLFERTGGVPLAIVWSVAKIGLGYSPEAVLRQLGHPTADISRFCFEASVASIEGTYAHKLLMALALFTTDASRESLGYVAGLGDDVLSRDEGLALLEQLSLANKSADRFTLLPLTKSFTLGELDKNSDFKRGAQERWIQYYVSLCSTISKEEYAAFPRMDAEYENILTLMDWCWYNDRTKALVDLMVPFVNYLWARGHWSDWKRYGELGLEAAERENDRRSEAVLLRSLGGLSLFRGQLNEAESLLTPALRMRETMMDDTNEYSYIVELLSEIYTYREGFDKATLLVKGALETVRTAGDERSIARLERTLGVLALRQRRYAEARQWLETSRRYRESREEISGGLSMTYLFLGRTAVGEGDLTLAEHYYTRALTISEQIGIRHTRAYAKWNLARLARKLGQSDRASKLASEARDIFDRLGIQRQVAEVDAFLAGPITRARSE